MAASSSIWMMILLAVLLSYFHGAPAQEVVPGLSFNFYDYSCPKFESIVRKQMTKAIKKDIGLAAGLIRLQFHDCSVQGCDGSVLLDGSASGPGEQQAVPNLSLRASAFAAIEDLRSLVHKKCGRVVSCADIVAVAARDSVFLTGGPDYEIPFGRRDSLNFANINETLANLPSPSFNTSTLLIFAATKNLTATDVVTLSGAHTMGIAHCQSFTERLYPTQDPTLDQTFAKNLKLICPTLNSTNTTVLDIRTPNKFDNKYYVDLMNRQGLFTSDQDLYTDSRTRGIVTSFAINQSLFFEQFIKSIIKMGQLNVTTGNQGEIRANCSARNSDNAGYLMSSMTKDHDNGVWSAM